MTKKQKINFLIILIISISCQNSFCQHFRSRVYFEKKWYLIDSSGFEFDSSYQEIKSFNNGLAAAKLNNKWGYIGMDAKFKIQPTFILAYDFNDGYAIVCKYPGQYTIIDTTGKDILKNNYSKIKNYSEGIFFAKKKGDDFSNFFNINELELNTNLFITWSSSFKNGRAIVRTEENSYKIIDKNGTILYETICEKFKPIENGFYRIYKNKYWEYIDSTFNKLTPPIFSYTDTFNSDGVAIVRFNRGRNKNYLLKNNGMIIDWEYTKMGLPQEGVIAVKSKNKWGYVNYNGEIIIPFIFQRAFDFNDGIAKVKANKKIGYINKKGEWIIEPNLKAGFDCKNGFIYAKSNTWQFYNSQGKPINHKKYAYVKQFDKIE